MLCFFPREDYEWLAEALEEADGSGGIGGDYPDLGVGVQVRHNASLFLLPHCCAPEFPLFILMSHFPQNSIPYYHLLTRLVPFLYFQPEQRLRQILLKGGVPHEPSHNVIRHEVVRSKNSV